MEFCTFQASNLRFHLRYRAEVGGSMMRTPPVLRLHFNFGPSRHCYVLPHFWNSLQDPIAWQREVRLMLITVLRSGDSGSYDVSLLAALFCRHLEAYLCRFPPLYGRAMSVNAFVDILRLLTPPLAAGDSMWIPERGPYYPARGVPLTSAPEYFEAEFVDDVMMLSLVGEGSGVQTPVPSPPPPPYMERVKVVTFGAEAGEAEVYPAAGESCSICLEEFEAGQQLDVMPCHHGFHVGCLEKWLARSHSCPLCRFDLSSGSSQEG